MVGGDTGSRCDDDRKNGETGMNKLLSRHDAVNKDKQKLHYFLAKLSFKRSNH